MNNYGFIEVDKRGKHKNQKQIDSEIKQSVRDHIPKFDTSS